MASESEPAKMLLPYLQRADELQKHEPLVAYYCRLYAMERGMKIPANERTKTTNALLRSLINQLEKDKKSLTLGPEDNLHLEGFALNVFGKADKQDRAGRADLNTAKTFYAASIFFEILNQFGPLQPDLEQKQKYAAWKAADIRKAIKEGRNPTAGPPIGDDDLTIPSSTPGGSSDMGPSEIPGPSLGSESGSTTQFHDNINNYHSTGIPPPSSQFTGPSLGSESGTTTQFHDNINNYHSTGIPPPSSQFHDKFNDHHPTNIPTPSQFHNNYGDRHSTNIHPQTSRQFHDKVDDEHATNIPPPSYTSASYPNSDFHPPPPANRTESSAYSQPYVHQSYPQEPQHHIPQNYPSNEPASSFSYPNFQSYPSFSESSLPSAPSHHPYYQGPDSSYTSHSSPSATNYSSSGPITSNNRNGSVSEPAIPPPAQTYQYDSNYQPPPEKIAEAHKAARFAVGALAFDDVSVAVDYLKKSLELLTKPSASN